MLTIKHSTHTLQQSCQGTYFLPVTTSAAKVYQWLLNAGLQRLHFLHHLQRCALCRDDCMHAAKQLESTFVTLKALAAFLAPRQALQPSDDEQSDEEAVSKAVQAELKPFKQLRCRQHSPSSCLAVILCA